MQRLVKNVRAALEAGGLCPVTRGTALGLEPQSPLQTDSTIQTLARWRSKVCKRDVKSCCQDSSGILSVVSSFSPETER